jgi:hypothetical protein
VPSARVADAAPALGKADDAVIVVDQAGNARCFDADDWTVTESGHAEVLKDGKRVASFAPGYIAAYRKSARRTDLPGLPTLVTRW